MGENLVASGDDGALTYGITGCNDQDIIYLSEFMNMANPTFYRIDISYAGNLNSA